MEENCDIGSLQYSIIQFLKKDFTAKFKQYIRLQHMLAMQNRRVCFTRLHDCRLYERKYLQLWENCAKRRLGCESSVDASSRRS